MTLLAETFSLEDFRARAAERLLPAPPDPDDPETVPIGEHFLLPPDKIPRAAAVLVGLVAREEPQMLLTLRARHLPVHAGQVAFPGGKREPDDASPLATAIREAQEEIGLDPALVTPLGYLDLYVTNSGFGVVGVVAEIDPSYRLTLDPNEVEDVFEAPLAFLMNAENHKVETREWRGGLREVHLMPWENRNIWGVTAGVLKNLYDRLYAP
ncbi:CoA pyrophosphatase [Chelatococcus sambhunathii]|uniref:CoA pyrophosphatase n=1 Tax=Chelatococcus sambhunathii TaxID=363953 RepID=A0ABU1DKM8_9HYPH|nr:CoA pyrophosphatase [Chelatococcus sambhunathii]MDR4308673.1 CoA pyrophosphatase [Chelatococcus sambhunathii]